jgi:hypothetical protein
MPEEQEQDKTTQDPPSDPPPASDQGDGAGSDTASATKGDDAAE